MSLKEGPLWRHTVLSVLAQKHSAGPGPKQEPVRERCTVPPMFLEMLWASPSAAQKRNPYLNPPRQSDKLFCLGEYWG